MVHRLTALSFMVLLSASAAGPATGQEAKGIGPTGSLAGVHQKSQVELVRKVNAYFNQVTTLEGTFVQTGADNKRQRGKFYISRPGRFRFEFNPPSKVVIISDGRYIAIQDRDLSTDDRWDLGYTPFRALLQDNVDLLRDARVLDAEEKEDAISIVFEDKDGDSSSRIRLFLAAKPSLQIKGWIAKDAQGFDTRTDLVEMHVPAGQLDANLFNPAAR
ncbi:MAG: outer-membrane lipoprotein carrier protein LolA [Hyphomicrobiaceae bacterium]|nr:outer-membrane lipoprotein carrier protein LolA [Hyphomicrobiaceae bacterium]